MGWYVSYYLGYKTKEGKIYPFFPFDSTGKLHPIVTKSRSFASDLWERFERVTAEEVTEELKKHFPKGREDNSDIPWCFWLDVNELPMGSVVKKGYYLQEDISRYENNKEYFDGFFEYLTPDEYVRKMESELKFGIPKPKKDCEGNELEMYSCGEYSYYAYVDTDSAEYEAFLIKRAIDSVEYADIPKGSRIVVLETNY